jgi:hypothetical protein
MHINSYSYIHIHGCLPLYEGGNTANGNSAFKIDVRFWPRWREQSASLVGTVLRAKPHKGGKAGVTASFIAVRRP